MSETMKNAIEPRVFFFNYNDIRNVHTYLLLKLTKKIFFSYTRRQQRKETILIAWSLRFATRTHCDVNKQTDNKHFRYAIYIIMQQQQQQQ